MKGKFGGSIPEITGASFNATRTLLTIGIRLEPGRDYAIPFGPGFTSDDGYPNETLELRFHTKAGRPR